jgi:hypothetical protein
LRGMSGWMCGGAGAWRQPLGCSMPRVVLRSRSDQRLPPCTIVWRVEQQLSFLRCCHPDSCWCRSVPCGMSWLYTTSSVGEAEIGLWGVAGSAEGDRVTLCLLPQLVPQWSGMHSMHSMHGHMDSMHSMVRCTVIKPTWWESVHACVSVRSVVLATHRLVCPGGSGASQGFCGKGGSRMTVQLPGQHRVQGGPPVRLCAWQYRARGRVCTLQSWQL